VFDDLYTKAFETLRAMLISAPVLAHYDLDSQCLLKTDALDTVIVAIFLQKGLDGEWHPVGYFLKTMTPAETNYPIYNKELLAVV
jgi:hypothetical protein